MDLTVLLMPILGFPSKYIAKQTHSWIEERMVVQYEKKYRGRNRDYNRHHLKAAQCWNLRDDTDLPTASLAGLSTLSSLRKIETSSMLVVSPMRHSRPVLHLAALEILDEIAVRFQTELQKKGLSRYRIVLTSGTRSRQSQATLQKVNSNAASETAHWYGYTFDIAYNVFIKRYFWEPDVPAPVLVKTLDSVLRTMRSENKIWVLGEKRQACFHITVRCPETL